MAQTRPGEQISGDTLQLWCAVARELEEEQVRAACLEILSSGERERFSQLKIERIGREYLLTRWLARIALSHNRAVAPGTWEFEAGEFGKPGIDPKFGLQFNLSNTRDMVVCAAASSSGFCPAVGVDVEPLSRGPQIAELASNVFSLKERADLDEMQGEERLRHATILWTLKEAYIKARGLGLRLPLKEISFVCDEREGMRLEVTKEVEDRVGGWRFCTMEHEGYRISIVAERQPDANCLDGGTGVFGSSWDAFQVHPPQPNPERIRDLKPHWFPSERSEL